MSNKENYEKLSKMISDGEDIIKIKDEFDVARSAMDSVDDAISLNELIPHCFKVAWDDAYETLNTYIDCNPKRHLEALKECLELIEYLEWKQYI